MGKKNTKKAPATGWERWLEENKLSGDHLCYPKGDARRYIVLVNHICHKVLLTVAQLSVIAMLCIVFFNVVLRYCFNTGIGWVEEIPKLLVILFSFLACAVGVRDHLHISVTIIYNRCPRGGIARKVFDTIADISTLFCGLFLLYYGITFIANLNPGWLPMTGLPTWLQYIPAPICGFIMTFDSILFLTGILKADDLLFSEPEVDYVQMLKDQKAEAAAGGSK